MAKHRRLIGLALEYAHWKNWRKKVYGWVRRMPKPPKPVPAPKPVVLPRRAITMYDSVNVAMIPKDAAAVAGYVGGRWPTFSTLVKEFPNAHKLSIAIAASEDADCLDIEPRDATPDQAAAWVKRQHARGKKQPVVYTSAAFLQALVNKLAAAGLVHGHDYKIWSAHYTFKRHRCSPACGFGIKVTADATQYSDKALGRNLDVSVCSPSFFPAGTIT